MFSKYCVPKNSYIYLSNGSNYEYHFIIKELPEKIKKQITSLGENTAKYINFIAPIEKWLTRIGRKIDMCLKKYETDPDFFFSSWISMESSLKKDYSEIRSFNRYWCTVINGRKV